MRRMLKIVVSCLLLSTAVWAQRTLESVTITKSAPNAPDTSSPSRNKLPKVDLVKGGQNGTIWVIDSAILDDGAFIQLGSAGSPRVITAAGDFTTTGDVNAKNLAATAGNVTATGNIAAGGDVTGTNVGAIGNVTGTNVLASGNVMAGSATVAGNTSTGRLSSAGDISSGADITAIGAVNGASGSFVGPLGGVLGWDQAVDTPATGQRVLIGVTGLISNTTGSGVFGRALSNTGDARGVSGRTQSKDGKGVYGLAQPDAGQTSSGYALGVHGQTYYDAGSGVMGESFNSDPDSSASGVYGVAHTNHGSGVFGWVDGASSSGNGVFGINSGIGGVGILAYTNSADANANTLAMRAHNATMNGAALEVAVNAGKNTDLIRGVVQDPATNTSALIYRVDRNGVVHTGPGADIAEHIDVTEAMLPGDVVEIDPNAPGRFRKVRSAQSTMVAGIVSTLPGVALGNGGGIDDARPLLALVGRVPVNVSDENGPVKIGDLLTSSSTPGFAMRCSNPATCTGAIVGKAMEPLNGGKGKVLALVTLR